ncbi:MAG: FAD-binding oxidoreductase [Microbacteriaceae bacterium]|nr:FAD-binding oxidoreductase [Microbacteriaceae bacterium]
MHTTVFERNAPRASAIDHAITGVRHSPFWLEDAAAAAYPRLTGALECDLAVVGAGYCGLWTAIKAKRADPSRRVVVLEAKTVGWAASGRNGGFVEASLTHGEDNGASRFPAEINRLNELGLANLDAIEATIAELGVDCDWERNGAIDLAVEPYQLEALRGELRPDQVFLDADTLAREVRSPTYLGGVWNTRTSALVHPGKLATELARVATEHGVEIFEHSKVNAVVTRDSALVSLPTRHGKVLAVSVALATNVFPSLLRRNRLQTVPVYDYVLMTEPLSAEQLASIGWSNRQGLGDGANQFHYYRLSADNRILFGGYDAINHFGQRVDPRYENREDSYRRLASHFLTTFPQLAGIRFSHRWAGPIDTSTRFCAFFGTARQGRVAYAAGFTGLGLASTHFAADVMLDLLSGVQTELTELEMVRSRPLPFPPEPVASIGIQLTRWSLDRADHNRGRRNLLLRGLDAVGLGFDS